MAFRLMKYGLMMTKGTAIYFSEEILLNLAKVPALYLEMVNTASRYQVTVRILNPCL